VLSIGWPFLRVATPIIPLKTVLGYFNWHSSISIAFYSRYQRIYFTRRKRKIQHAVGIWAEGVYRRYASRFFGTLRSVSSPLPRYDTRSEYRTEGPSKSVRCSIHVLYSTLTHVARRGHVGRVGCSYLQRRRPYTHFAGSTYHVRRT
jgi:hypothetical protein